MPFTIALNVFSSSFITDFVRLDLLSTERFLQNETYAHWICAEAYKDHSNRFWNFVRKVKLYSDSLFPRACISVCLYPFLWPRGIITWGGVYQAGLICKSPTHLWNTIHNENFFKLIWNEGSHECLEVAMWSWHYEIFNYIMLTNWLIVSRSRPWPV